MEKDGRPWVKTLSNEEIFSKTFNCANLLQTNNHPILESIKEVFFADYLVEAKFTYLGYNGDSIYCNGRKLVYRNDKNKPIQYTNTVELLDSKSLKYSGSNKYPTAHFVDGWCILRFVSNGLPIIDSLNGWDIEIILMEEIK